MNLDKCKYCGSNIKKETSSLHVWEITYECGYKIFGAIDSEINDIIEKEKCKNNI